MGLHRVTWNLHRPGTEAWERSSVEREFDNNTRRGSLAPPGDVHVGTMVNGVFKDLGLAPGEAVLIPGWCDHFLGQPVLLPSAGFHQDEQWARLGA